MKLRAAKLAIALVSVAAAVLGLASYWQDATLAVQAAHAELAGAAELKTLVVVRWVAAVKNGARSLADMPVLSEEVRHWMAEPRSPQTRRDLQRWLELVRAFGGCTDASVLDAAGRLLMASPARERDSRPIVGGLGEGPEIVPAGRPLGEGDEHRIAFRFELARSSRESRENGSREVAGGQPNLEAGAVSPRPAALALLGLARSSGESKPAPTPLGSLLLEVDPYTFLLPVLAAPPGPHRSAVTVLAHREGKDAVVLHPLASRADRVLVRRHRISQDGDLPAIQAILGRTGAADGRDYRGVPVFAQARAVPGTPWFLVTKVDRDEILGPLRRSYGTGAAVAALGLLLLGAAHEALGRRRELATLDEELATQRRLRAAAEAVREYSKRLEALSGELWRAQETERRRLAHELHDEIGQALTALKLTLQRLRASAGATMAAGLDDSEALAGQILKQIREMALDLRPSMLDDHGLESALRWLVQRQTQRAGLEHQFSSNLSARRYGGPLETVCYRVVQEALTNVLRHAHARHLTVELRDTGIELLVVVRDDGAGFDTQALGRPEGPSASLGLSGMQERVHQAGGSLSIESRPGAGTSIQARFGLPGGAPRPA